MSSHANSYDSNRYVISIQEIAIPNSIGICNHDQQSTGTIFRIVWLIFTRWLLLAWAIICCLFQSRRSRQSLYLHGNWNYQEYCVSTSIGKLNILETCIFFFFSPPFKQTKQQQRVAGYSKYPHKTLNTSKGVVRSAKLSLCSIEEIEKELKKPRCTGGKKNNILEK